MTAISALEDFIENPEVVELKNERKELVKERNVAKMLIRYINSLQFGGHFYVQKNGRCH